MHGGGGCMQERRPLKLAATHPTGMHSCQVIWVSHAHLLSLASFASRNFDREKDIFNKTVLSWGISRSHVKRSIWFKLIQVPNKNAFQYDAYRPLVTVRGGALSRGGEVSVRGTVSLTEPPPRNRITDACENFTLSQLR